MSGKIDNKILIRILEENLAALNKQEYSLEKEYLIDMYKDGLKKLKVCPYCYGNLIMFHSDLDVCDSCKKQFFP